MDWRKVLWKGVTGLLCLGFLIKRGKVHTTKIIYKRTTPVESLMVCVLRPEFFVYFNKTTCWYLNRGWFIFSLLFHQYLCKNYTYRNHENVTLEFYQQTNLTSFHLKSSNGWKNLGENKPPWNLNNLRHPTKSDYMHTCVTLLCLLSLAKKLISSRKLNIVNIKNNKQYY